MPNPPNSSFFNLQPSGHGSKIRSRLGVQNVQLYAIFGSSPWGHQATVSDRDPTLNPKALQPISVSVSLLMAPPEDRILRAAREDGLAWSLHYGLVLAAIRKTVTGKENVMGEVCVPHSGGALDQAGCAKPGVPVFDSIIELGKALVRATLEATDEKCVQANVTIDMPASMLVAGGTVNWSLDASLQDLKPNQVPNRMLVRFDDIKLRLLVGMNKEERLYRQTVRMWLEVWDEKGLLSAEGSIGNKAVELTEQLETTSFQTLEALAAFTTGMLLGKAELDEKVNNTWERMGFGRVSVRLVKPCAYVGTDGPMVEMTRYRDSD